MSVFMNEQQHIGTRVVFHDGCTLAGHAIGILVLDLSYPALPGNVQNATTFRFPVHYHIVRGSTFKRLLSADPTLCESIIAGAKELERQGVRAIIGACGYFGNFQEQVANELRVPVFLSSLLQVPIIKCGLKPYQKVGIICGDKKGLSGDLLRQCGVSEPSSAVIAGAQDLPEFQNLFHGHGNFNNDKIQQELVDLACSLLDDNEDIGAILLECSDMPPYACGVQNATKLPVFDYVTLVNWVYGGVVRHTFSGFM